MKVWNYVIISLSIILLLSFMGFNTGGTSQILGIAGFNYTTSNQSIDSIDVQQSYFYSFLFGNLGILTVIAVAGGVLISGLFARYSLENLIILPFIIYIPA